MVEILLNSTTMKTISLKVDEVIADELDYVKKQEGLGNRTSTVTFLIKYYFLTKKRSFEEKAELMGLLLRHIDWDKVPSLDEQLKDV